MTEQKSRVARLTCYRQELPLMGS